MDGIQFLVDGQGKKTAVQIDLEKHAEIWDDFYDTCIARERAREPRESLAEVKEKLRAKGKL
jgi:hypothetical protein